MCVVSAAVACIPKHHVQYILNIKNIITNTQNSSCSGVPIEATSTTQESVILITGGSYGSGVEVYPSSPGCSLPPLPTWRYGHQTFVTSDSSPMVATCGGIIGPSQTDTCLVLDLINQRWDESRMGNLTTPRWYGAVAALKDIGVFHLGGNRPDSRATSDFLPVGSLQWQQGPALPISMSVFCTAPITPSSFLTIHKNKIFEFDTSIAGPTSNEGWQEWQGLKTRSSSYTTCAKIGNKVIIAGGYHNRESLRSTEILDITTRTLSSAGEMASTRLSHALVAIRSSGQRKLFALGGLGHIGNFTPGQSATLFDTVEEWVEETSTWKEAESLSRAMRFFGAVALPKESVCPS